MNQFTHQIEQLNALLIDRMQKYEFALITGVGTIRGVAGDINHSEAVSANIVEMVYRVGETMKVRVVAEGVETDKHVQFLASKYPNVHLQGYAFGRPQPLSSVLSG